MESKATAVWKGGLKDGSGTISNESGVLADTAYTFAGRFENAGGTNPEELIASAHAGCFSMALSAQLGEAGLTPEHVSTTATTTLEVGDGGPGVRRAHTPVFRGAVGADALCQQPQRVRCGSGYFFVFCCCSFCCGGLDTGDDKWHTLQYNLYHAGT